MTTLQRLKNLADEKGIGAVQPRNLPDDLVEYILDIGWHADPGNLYDNGYCALISIYQIMHGINDDDQSFMIHNYIAKEIEDRINTLVTDLKIESERRRPESFRTEERKDLLEAVDYYIWAHARPRTEWLEPPDDRRITIDLLPYAQLRDKLLYKLDPELWNLRSVEVEFNKQEGSYRISDFNNYNNLKQLNNEKF